MKTKNEKFWLLKSWVLLTVFLVASCSTEKMDDLLDEVQNSKELTGFNESLDLKQGNAAQNQLLAQVRRATAKYQRVEVAIADGYLEASHCVYNEELGAGMGYHFVKQELVGPFFDPLKPQALLYERDKHGEFKLIGVEYIVIDIGQDHPLLGNQPFDIGGTPIPVDHYSLHVWIWKNNPLGMYIPYNPKVKCN
jgi:hypothetical protein